MVLQLSEGLKGRNITCDNFFCSVPLAKEFSSRGQTIVGTVRKNRKELPAEFVNPKNRKAHSTIKGYYEDNVLISYCPKKGKTVVLLSNMHDSITFSEKEDKKPNIIEFYNETKGGVDTL